MEIPKRGEVFRGRVFDQVFICVLRTSKKNNRIYAMVIEDDVNPIGKTYTYNMETFDRYYTRAKLGAKWKIFGHGCS